MLMPVGDDNRDRRSTPIINYLLVALNVFVFVYFQGCGTNEKFTYAFSTVPAEIVSGKDVVTEDQTYQDKETGETYTVPGLQPTPILIYLTLITSMFMHGGWAHIIGNMIYLLIFGDNVEDRIGHLKYLIFYLLVGVLASLAHVFTSVLLNSDLLIPSLGASGAISGVLAAYWILFPRRRVRVIFFYHLTDVPASFAIGIWFIFQLIYSLGALGGSGGDGVAYAAHIGGFIAGLLLIKLFDTDRY